MKVQEQLKVIQHLRLATQTLRLRVKTSSVGELLNANQLVNSESFPPRLRGSALK